MSIGDDTRRWPATRNGGFKSETANRQMGGLRAPFLISSLTRFSHLNKAGYFLSPGGDFYCRSTPRRPKAKRLPGHGELPYQINHGRF